MTFILDEYLPVEAVDTSTIIILRLIVMNVAVVNDKYRIEVIDGSATIS